ncbi:citrate transporter [Anaerosporomusa subterranea]|uniref:Citrate transporter n=1 Tax=Anaerosporomusa subterranea TaxID=1794912 RepID=A0A154BPD9_ANASB|nr:citrate transporter [Anaerosporomusa subterranea]
MSKGEIYLINALISVLPLIVILVLLFKRVNMIAAGLVGGILAMLIGGISLAAANKIFLDTMPLLLTIMVPIINSAIAFAVFKSGGYTSALTLMNRAVNGRVEMMAVFIVFLQAAATYMSGIGGGTAVVLAPLAFAAVGVIPEVIAGMSIAAAVSFTTSPASLESSIYSKLTGVGVQDYVSFMRPYWIIFSLIALGIAYYGAKKRGVLVQPGSPVEQNTSTDAELWRTTLPAIFLLFSVLAGPFVNKAVGMPLLSPLVYSITTILLIAVCTKMKINDSFNALMDGSSYILTRLFGVGFFLTFIYMIEKIGAFKTIASIAQAAPDWLMNPAAVLAGFLIGVPAGAYVGTVLAMIIPVTVALKFSPLSMGFVVMGVGLGSQMSFVNITMQALSSGFQIPIEQVSKGNSPWVLMCMAILLVMSLVLV